eukprot:scaffold11579_cov40-Cyclotella_meneghiniana.AAC.4
MRLAKHLLGQHPNVKFHCSCPIVGSTAADPSRNHAVIKTKRIRRTQRTMVLSVDALSPVAPASQLAVPVHKYRQNRWNEA